MFGRQRLAFSLMYHDVVNEAAETVYEIDSVSFTEHLVAIREALKGRSPGLATESADDAASTFLTFDDGHESAYTTIAPLLESFGWRGHFFIISRFIGRPGVMSPEQISELSERGHEIGSHSATHPERFGHLPPVRIVEEWRESTERLAEILGRRVRTASVPHGDFTSQVAQLAAASGIDTLFTSTPATRARVIDGCTVYGRFSVQRDTSANQVTAFATGSLPALFRERAFWELKSIAKSAGGPLYYRTRRLMLQARSR